MGNKYIGLAAALVLAFGSGCNKSAPPPPAAPPAASAASFADGATIARIHWLGKDRLGAETNAAALMKIWRSPESARLEKQTLEKLSRAPWRLLYGDAKATNAANALLEPLLSDLVEAESYIEIRQPTNQSAELAFAIRLKEERAKLWESNLAGVLESLTGNKSAPAAGGGWQIQFSNQLSTLSAQSSQPSTLDTRHSTLCTTRAGEWTLVGVGSEKNGLISEFQARIGRDHAPFGPRGTNFWLEAEVDGLRLASLLPHSESVSEALPKISATIIGDGENVRTRAGLEFPNSLPIKLKPWILPTNLISGKLVGFTAAKGVAPLLRRIGLFSGFKPEIMPDELYAWDRFGSPFATFFALRTTNAADAFMTTAPRIRDFLNSYLGPDFGSVSMETNAGKLSWAMAFGAPFLQAITNRGPEFLFGGFSPHFFARTNQPLPELFAHISGGTNLVYFDWEITGQSLAHFRYLDDTARIVFDAAHAPRLRQSDASMQWIGANLTNLQMSVSEVKLTDANRLAFARKSTIGLSALEINLLANWLELPQFPHGFGTIFVTNTTPRVFKRKSNPDGTSVPR